ncbi:MAG: hypothetical protein V1838_02890 [Patescibacteria group bacterium]
MKKQDVHGFKVFFEKDAQKGVNYLDHDLDYKEAEIFFRNAKFRGETQFEDDDDRDYDLTYDRNKGTYTVIKRKKSGGWF